LFFDKFLISSGPVEFLTISITDRKISVLWECIESSEFRIFSKISLICILGHIAYFPNLFIFWVYSGVLLCCFYSLFWWLNNFILLINVFYAGYNQLHTVYHRLIQLCWFILLSERNF
jgi:hypothetical protein